MAKIKKYVTKVNEGSFFARLARSEESSSIVEQGDFNTHFEAMCWLENELDKKLNPYTHMSFFELFNLIKDQPNNNKIRESFKLNLEILKEQIIFTFVAKEGVPLAEALKRVDSLCGKKMNESLIKAKDKSLDALMSLDEEKKQERLQNLLEYGLAAKWVASPFAKQVLGIIKSIPGEKRITTIVEFKEKIFDIKENGSVGNAKEHESILLSLIDKGLKSSESSFVIRQFIPGSDWKALYGFILSEDSLIPISDEDMEYAFTHDQNDKLIEFEDNIIYKNFEDYL